jgi:hypothetical protein
MRLQQLLEGLQLRQQVRHRAGSLRHGRRTQMGQPSRDGGLDLRPGGRAPLAPAGRWAVSRSAMKSCREVRLWDEKPARRDPWSLALSGLAACR